MTRNEQIKLSVIFEEKTQRLGFRGDPYFRDHLKERAENMEIVSPNERVRFRTAASRRVISKAASIIANAEDCIKRNGFNIIFKTEILLRDPDRVDRLEQADIFIQAD